MQDYHDSRHLCSRDDIRCIDMPIDRLYFIATREQSQRLFVIYIHRNDKYSDTYCAASHTIDKDILLI